MESMRGTPGGAFFIETPDAATVFTPEDKTAEHRMIEKTARDFVEKEVAPAISDIDKPDYNRLIPLLKQAGELGLLGYSVPEAYGGLGLDSVTKCIVSEAVGKTGSYGVAHINHVGIATLPIVYFGTPEQKEKYLEKLATGEYLGAYCLTEPSAGSDALSARTTARLNEEGTHYLLNGTKQFITNAGFADTFIVYAKIDGKLFTAFMVEKDYPGLSLGPEEHKMGIKGSSTRQVYFEDCPVPVENVIGEIGRGHVIALNVLNLGRFNLGAAATGSAKKALKLTLEYTSNRSQFGRPLFEFTSTQERLATVAARIYAAESMLYRTAGLLDRVLSDGAADGADDGQQHEGFSLAEADRRLREYAMECAACKVFGSELLDFAVDEGVQLHGGYGFLQDYEIERMYRDARINRIFEGTNEINRLFLIGNGVRKLGKAPNFMQVLQSARTAFESASGSRAGATQTQGTKAGATQAGAAQAVEATEVVRTVRTAFLAVLGYALQKYGENLEGEQEVVMRLADLAISLYAMESAALRMEKSKQAVGVGAGRVLARDFELIADLAETYVLSTALSVERIVRELLSVLLSGNELWDAGERVHQLFAPYLADEQWMGRKRRIADALHHRGGYLS